MKLHGCKALDFTYVQYACIEFNVFGEMDRKLSFYLFVTPIVILGDILFNFFLMNDVG